MNLLVARLAQHLQVAEVVLSTFAYGFFVMNFQTHLRLTFFTSILGSLESFFSVFIPLFAPLRTAFYIKDCFLGTSTTEESSFDNYILDCDFCFRFTIITF